MVQVVIVHGYELWQRSNARWFAGFARKRLRAVSAVQVRDASRECSYDTFEWLKAVLSADCDTLLYVHAHGSKLGTWDFEREEPFYHGDLAVAVCRARGRVLVVNDSCYGGILAEWLERAGADPAKVGLIASSRKDTVSFSGHLIDGLVASWGRRQVFGERVMAHVCDGGPPSLFGPPVGAIRVGNPLLRLWDLAVYRVRRAVYAVACLVFPYHDWQVRSLRWGAVLDPMLWSRPRRRRRR